MALLERNLIGELFSTMDSSILRSKLREVWSGINDIKELSSFMVLVTFDSLEAKNPASDSGLVFCDVRPWSFSEWSFFRKVWLECIGLQPHAWSFHILHIIGEN